MKVSTVGKSLSEVEWAYIAGFLDGDGAIMATIEKHPEKRFRFRVRLCVKVTQFHRKDVEWLCKSVGIGRIRSNRRTFEWILVHQKAIESFLEKIGPYSRCKKRQISLARQILAHRVEKFEDLQKIAHLADTLSSFNVRSRNRRKNFASMIEKSDSRND